MAVFLKAIGLALQSQPRSAWRIGTLAHFFMLFCTFVEDLGNYDPAKVTDESKATRHGIAGVAREIGETLKPTLMVHVRTRTRTVSALMIDLAVICKEDLAAKSTALVELAAEIAGWREAGQEPDL